LFFYGLHPDVCPFGVIIGRKKSNAQGQVILEHFFCFFLLRLGQQRRALEGIADGNGFVFFGSHARVQPADGE